MNEKGFTLVEMIVSVALFAIVMLVCVGALLSLVNANRKAQALQSVMNNLNIALDGMVRSIRMGNNYFCGDTGYTPGVDAASCPDGGDRFAFEPFNNVPSDDPWIYTYGEDEHGVGRIYKSVEGNIPVPITAPEVSIDQMHFYTVGTRRGDTTQPKVVIVIEGTAGVRNSRTGTTFHIQATAVQRVLDL